MPFPPAVNRFPPTEDTLPRPVLLMKKAESGRVLLKPDGLKKNPERRVMIHEMANIFLRLEFSKNFFIVP